MKNKLLILMAMFSLLLILGTSQAYADIVTDIDPPETGAYWFGDDENPYFLAGTDPVIEAEWLSSLLGFPVYFLDKDEEEPFTPWEDGWDYAVLKYGGNIRFDFDGDGDLDTLMPHLAVTYGSSFPESISILFPTGDGTVYDSGGLSHVSYFSTTPVPEPATMLLFGSGLIGLAAVGRKRFRK